MEHFNYHDKLLEISERLEDLYQYLVENPGGTVTIRDVRAFLGLSDKCAGYNAKLKREVFSTTPHKSAKPDNR